MKIISSFAFALDRKFHPPFHPSYLPPASPGLRSRALPLSLPRKGMNASTEAGVARMASTSLDAGGSGDDVRETGDVLVQYIVLRRDLIDAWPLGSVVTQGCHAAVAAIWSHRDRVDTAAYLSATNLDSMHKVTLEVKGENQMRNLAEKLTAEGVEHKLWIEQPENTPTCLATRPYPKSFVASYFKKLKLCK